MPPPSQPEPAHRQHQRLEERLSKCIRFIKSTEGGGFKTFGDFMIKLFTELPTDSSSGHDSAYQTVLQTTRAFLKWNPLKGLLDKVFSHTEMMARDENTQGIDPSYCVSPGLPALEGMVLLLQYRCNLSHINMEVMTQATIQPIQLAVEYSCVGPCHSSLKKLTRRLKS